jgi:hypothetical protein
VSIQQLDELGFFPTDEREMGVAFNPEEGMDALGITITKSSKAAENGSDDRPPGMTTQISLLYTREFLNLRRDVTSLVARFLLSIILSTLIGIIFLHVGASDPSVFSNVQSRFGAMLMLMLMSMFGTAQPSLLAFPAERPVFLREYSTNHYSVVSYFMARFTVEAVITGAQVLVMVRPTLTVVTSPHHPSDLTSLINFCR